MRRDWFYWYFSWTAIHKLIGLRVGPIYFKIKPTYDELFSERNGYHIHALRIRGMSFILGHSWSPRK